MGEQRDETHHFGTPSDPRPLPRADVAAGANKVQTRTGEYKPATIRLALERRRQDYQKKIRQLDALLEHMPQSYGDMEADDDDPILARYV